MAKDNDATLESLPELARFVSRVQNGELRPHSVVVSDSASGHYLVRIETTEPETVAAAAPDAHSAPVPEYSE